MLKNESQNKMLVVKFQEGKTFWYKDGADAKPEKITRPQLDERLAKYNRVWDAQATYRESDLSSVKLGSYWRHLEQTKIHFGERLRLAQEQLVIVNYRDETRGFGVEMHPNYLGKTGLAAIPYNGPFVLNGDKLFSDASREVIFVSAAEKPKKYVGAFSPKPGHIHYCSLMMHAPTRSDLAKIYFFGKEVEERILVSGNILSQELGPRGVPLVSAWPFSKVTDSRFLSISYGWEYFSVRKMPMYLTDKETGEFIPAVQEARPLYLLPKHIPVESPTEDIVTVQLPGVAFKIFIQDIARILGVSGVSEASTLKPSLILGILGDQLLLTMPNINTFLKQVRSNNLSIEAKVATMVARSGVDSYQSGNYSPMCVPLREYMMLMIMQANSKKARVNTLVDLNKLYNMYGINDADRGAGFERFKMKVSAEMSVPRPVSAPEIVLSADLLSAIKKNLSEGAKTASLIQRGMFLINSLTHFESAVHSDSGGVTLSKGVQFIPLTIATKALIDSGEIPVGKSVRLLFCEDMLNQAKTFSESKTTEGIIKARYILSGIMRSKKKIDPQFSTRVLDQGLAELKKRF